MVAKNHLILIASIFKFSAGDQILRKLVFRSENLGVAVDTHEMESKKTSTIHFLCRLVGSQRQLLSLTPMPKKTPLVTSPPMLKQMFYHSRHQPDRLSLTQA